MKTYLVLLAIGVILIWVATKIGYQSECGEPILTERISLVLRWVSGIFFGLALPRAFEIMKKLVTEINKKNR